MFRVIKTFILFVSILIIGCSNDEVSNIPNEWKETATIQLTTENEKGEEIQAEWIGEEGLIAISNTPFIVGEPQKYMWLLWGNKNELVGKKFKVTARSEISEEITVVDSSLGGSNWGATASSPSQITLPSKGLWKLDAYVAENLYATLIVKVQ